MIEMFAAVEQAVAEALSDIGVDPHRLPALRLAALREALAPGTVHHEAAKPVLQKLAELDDLWRLRHFLCHGRGDVLMDTARRSHFSLFMRTPPEGMDQRRTWLVSRSEAESLRRRLASTVQSVTRRLDNFRSRAAA